MTNDFDCFLTECLEQGEQIFTSETKPLKAADTEVIEKELGINLPDSYKYFLKRCGSGVWCGEPISHPIELYAFDSDCLTIEGFVALVQNARRRAITQAFKQQVPIRHIQRIAVTRN